MTVNPFEFTCARCASPWPAKRDHCWNCGSTERLPNPDYGKPIPPPAPRLYRPVPVHVDLAPDDREAWWALFAVLLGVLGGIGAYSNQESWAAGIVAFIGTTGLAWTLFVVHLIFDRVKRIEAAVSRQAGG